jgi:hypothetical protein
MKRGMQNPELLYTMAVVLNSLVESFQCFSQHAADVFRILSMLAHVKSAIYDMEASSENHGLLLPREL